MTTYPTLYKRTKTGAIQQWAISIEASLFGTAIFKDAGQVGGKQTRHEELIAMGKNIGRSNETTPLEQAELQAKADWVRKHDEGYKSLDDLLILESQDGWGYWKTSTYWSGGYTDVQSVLEMALPKFNTDASGNVKPMLAKPVNWDKVTYPCYVQPKLDGVRCLMVVKAESPVVFLSRNGKEYTTLDHIKDDVTAFMCNETMGVCDSTDGFILDGEIYSDELTFQEIIAAVKKQRPDSLKLKFRAYDVVNDQAQNTRWVQTEGLVQAIGSDLVQAVETLTGTSREQVKMLHDKWVSEGNEGAMIRILAGTYDQGQRSSSLLKVKEFQDGEFKVVGGKIDKIRMAISEGTKYEPRAIRLVDSFTFVCEMPNGDTFDPKPVGTREQRAKYMTDLHLLIGKMLTVRHFGWTDDNLPRFPIGVSIRDYE